MVKNLTYIKISRLEYLNDKGTKLSFNICVCNYYVYTLIRVFVIRAQQPILKSVWAKRAQQQKVLFWQNLYLFSVECFEYIKQSYKDTFKCNVLIHHLCSLIVNVILKNIIEPFWQKNIYCFFAPLELNNKKSFYGKICICFQSNVLNI